MATGTHAVDGGNRSDLPLNGIRVLELGHIIAGPTAGLILADLGADVIKVERPGAGDQGRSAPSRNFLFFNRNKRSIAVDLSVDDGRAILARLVRRADIVVENFAPGALETLGFGYASLAALNPGIVYLSIKGFLPGPYELRPALDEVAQMMGGLAFMTGPAGRPLRAGASLIDMGAAAYGVIGVLAALVRRASTGLGEEITVGLYETCVFSVGQWMAQAASLRQQSVPMPESRMGPLMGWGVYDLFESRDGQHVFIALTSDAHWRAFCDALSLSVLRSRVDLDTNSQRIQARPWLLPMLADAIRERDRVETLRALERAGVPFAPVQRPDELFDDPHLNQSGQFLNVPMADGQDAKLPKLPLRTNDYSFRLYHGVPSLGKHTREVLRELGYKDADVEELVHGGVVGVNHDVALDR